MALSPLPLSGGRRKTSKNSKKGVSVKALKRTLKKAGLKTTGKKATLRARAKKAHLLRGGAEEEEVITESA